MDTASLDVVAVGSPLVDVLCHVTDETLDRSGLVRDSMQLIDLARAEELYAMMGTSRQVSGGSAANTAAGVAALGGTAGFVGKVADDEFGRIFSHDIRAAGVEFASSFDGRSGSAGNSSDAETVGTGRCLVLVDEGAGRTMCTHLGVATTIAPGDISDELIARGHIVYLEGYLWDAPLAKEALRHAASVAHDHDRSVALTLSDPFCVDRHRREFLDLIRDDIDVLFGNEEEITQLFQASSLEGALESVSETGLLVAVTRGAAGSVVMTARGPVEVPADPVKKVVDTTGAGDLFAAGFLYGLTHGGGPEQCARVGSACAAEVIGHLGARPEEDLSAIAGRLLSS